MAKKLIKHNDATGEIARPNRIKFKLTPGRQIARSPFKKIQAKNIWIAIAIVVGVVLIVLGFAGAL